MRKSLLRTVGVFVATIMLCLGALPAYADEPEIDCSVPGNCYTTRGLRTDDVIRYDNSLTGWGSVRVHIWGEDNGYNWHHSWEEGWDDVPFHWDFRPDMTNVGNNIWEYKIPTVNEYCSNQHVLNHDGYYENDEAERQACLEHYSEQLDLDSFCVDYAYQQYDGDWDRWDDLRESCLDDYSDASLTNYDGFWFGFDHMLFSDAEAGWGSGTQTIDLSFIESGYIYKSECIVGDGDCYNGEGEGVGSWRGYWYLYDKLELIDLLNVAKDYADGIDCIDEEEAKTFVNLVNDIDSKKDDEFIIKTDSEASSGWYWTYSDVAINELETQIESVKTKYGENPTLCKEDNDNPDTFDAFGLYVGLGIVSLAGLAIDFSIKRRA